MSSSVNLQPPLLSVVVPVYNAEKTIPKCFDSILSQELGDLELIAVDDGSTDRSGGICDEFQKRDPRVTVVRASHGGVSGARNAGLRAARGACVGFVDSDDFIDESFFGILYETLRASGSDMAVAAIKVYDAQGVERSAWNMADTVLNFEHLNQDLFAEFVEKFLLFGPCNKLYRSNIIRESGAFFDPAFSFGEDLLFNLRYLRQAKTVAITERAHYRYVRANAGSLSRKYRTDMAVTAENLHFALMDYFSSIGFTGPRASRILYGRLFDDFYNAMLFIARDRTLGFWKRRSKILSLMRNKEFLKSFDYLEAGKYSKPVVWMMRMRQAGLLLLYSILSRVRRRIL